MNEVSASQQLDRRDRHFLHAGNNPDRPTPPTPEPLLGQLYGLTHVRPLSPKYTKGQ
jgi:hypothetical protein